MNGKNICEVCALTITAAQEFMDALTPFAGADGEIAAKVLEEVRQRISFLHEVGLDYLTLDRLSSTLSGGESQRIQLATSLGSRLVGALYVLDEPSIGLHSRDTAKLVRIMEDRSATLATLSSSSSHDPDVIRAADYLSTSAPGAGELGGKLPRRRNRRGSPQQPNSVNREVPERAPLHPGAETPPRARARKAHPQRRAHPAQLARRRY